MQTQSTIKNKAKLAIPKKLQESVLAQSQRPRFGAAEAALIPMNMGDGRSFKDRDAGEEKMPILEVSSV